MHNACMPLIQIRDVPEPVRDELARKAAAAGQSMQAYLLAELSKLAERPSMAEIVTRAQARAKATGSTVTMNDAVAAVRSCWQTSTSCGRCSAPHGLYCVLYYKTLVLSYDDRHLPRRRADRARLVGPAASMGHRPD